MQRALVSSGPLRGRSRLSAAHVLLCVVAVGGTAAFAQSRASDPALTEVDRHERAGDLRGAAQRLAPITARFPDDYALTLRLAWLWYRAGEYAAAEPAYRRAFELSDGASDARVGLALSQAALQPNSVLTPALSFATRSDGIRGAGVGLALEVPAVLREHWLLSGTYRYWNFQGTTGGGFAQHEGHLALGYVTPTVGVALHYSLLQDGSGVVGRGHVAGLSTRLSAFGDVRFEASYSVYDSLSVARAALAYSLPLGARVRLTPGLAAQYAAGEWLGNASLTLSVDAALARFWLGGKYGDELRPAYLASATVVNVPERIAGGFFAGLDIPLGKRLSLRAAYDFSWLRTTTSQAAHGLTLGLSFAY